MKLDLLRIAEARPSLKEAADTLRSDIDVCAKIRRDCTSYSPLFTVAM